MIFHTIIPIICGMDKVWEIAYQVFDFQASLKEGRFLSKESNFNLYFMEKELVGESQLKYKWSSRLLHTQAKTNLYFEIRKERGKDKMK